MSQSLDELAKAMEAQVRQKVADAEAAARAKAIAQLNKQESWVVRNRTGLVLGFMSGAGVVGSLVHFLKL